MNSGRTSWGTETICPIASVAACGHMVPGTAAAPLTAVFVEWPLQPLLKLLPGPYFDLWIQDQVKLCVWHLMASWLWLLSEDALCVQRRPGCRGTKGAWDCTDSIYPKSYYSGTWKPPVTWSPSTSDTAVYVDQGSGVGALIWLSSSFHFSFCPNLSH